MNDKATRLREIRDSFTLRPYYGERYDGLCVFREWAKACGHFQAVDAVDAFMRFVEGDDA